MSETRAAALTFNEQERQAIAKAQEAARIMSERVGRPQDAPMSPMAARVDNEPVVFVAVAKPFRFNLDHHRRVEFAAGNYLCPTRLALDPWQQANGLTILRAEDIAQTLPIADLSPSERAAILRARADKMMQDAMKSVESAEAEAEAAEAEARAGDAPAEPEAGTKTADPT